MPRPTFAAKHWRARPGGVLAAILLLPVPAYATLTFSPWFFFSTNPSVVGATADPTGSIITFTFNGSGSGDFFIAGASTATWNNVAPNNLLATFHNWNTLTGTTGQVNFQVNYNTTTLTTGNVNLNGLSNQFSLGPTALASGAQFITFQVHFLPGSSWTGAPSSTVTLVFSTQ
jgi:hypothetical protein